MGRDRDSQGRATDCRQGISVDSRGIERAPPFTKAVGMVLRACSVVGAVAVQSTSSVVAPVLLNLLLAPSSAMTAGRIAVKASSVGYSHLRR